MASIYMALFIIILLLQQFLILPIRIAQLAMLVLGLACLQFYKKNSPNELVLIYCAFYTVGGIFSWVFNRNADLQEYLWIISSAGIAILMLNQKIMFHLIRIIYYFSMGLMCFLILINHGVDNLPMVSSRNAISSLGIFLFSIYTISAYQCNHKIHFASIITYVITSLLGIGRSGLLLAMALLVVSLLWNINKNTFHLRSPFQVCVIILVLIVACLVLYEKVIYPAFYNIAWRGIISQVRANTWISYIKKVYIDMGNIFWGAHISGDFWLDKYSRNLHNSFLNLHSKYGLGITLTIIILTFNALRYFVTKRKLILLIPFLSVIFRAQTDYTNFNGSADCVWYYFMFLPFFEYHNKLKHKLPKF